LALPGDGVDDRGSTKKKYTVTHLTLTAAGSES
jgi:hypothetical protein